MKICLLLAAVKSKLCNLIVTTLQGDIRIIISTFFDHFGIKFEDQDLYFGAIFELC